MKQNTVTIVLLWICIIYWHRIQQYGNDCRKVLSCASGYQLSHQLYNVKHNTLIILNINNHLLYTWWQLVRSTGTNNLLVIKTWTTGVDLLSETNMIGGQAQLAATTNLEFSLIGFYIDRHSHQLRLVLLYRLLVGIPEVASWHLDSETCCAWRSRGNQTV